MLGYFPRCCIVVFLEINEAPRSFEVTGHDELGVTSEIENIYSEASYQVYIWFLTG